MKLCRHYKNCDMVLSCFTEHMPPGFIENQIRINEVLNKINMIKKHMKETREELLNSDAQSMEELFYNYNERAERIELFQLQRELKELRQDEFNLKREWRDMI